MQNTSRIPYIPSTLIQNFFIAGVTQKTLTTRMSDVQDVRIPPEVLYSMYQPKESVAKYLPFVFPGQVTIELDAHVPKFYTFVSTDSDGFNSFFHCLIVFEEINEADIIYDFDKVTDILKHKSPKKKRDKSLKTEEDENNNNGLGETIFTNLRNDMKNKLKQRKDKRKCLYAEDIAKKIDVDKPKQQVEETTPRTPRAQLHKRQLVQSKRKQFELKRMISKITPDGIMDTPGGTLAKNLLMPIGTNLRFSASQNNSLIQRNITPLSPSKKQDKQEEGFLMPDQPRMEASKSTTPLSRRFRPSEDEEESHEFSKIEESVNFGTATNKVFNQQMKQQQQAAIIMQQTQDDYFAPKRKVTNMFRNERGFKEEPNMVVMNQEDIESEFHLSNQEGFQLFRGTFAKSQIESLIAKRKYVPVAFVMETSTEHHDIFKQILQSLYETIRIPEKLMTSSSNDDRILAFAELVAHVAFLKTIPAPIFNSVYNIQFLGQTLTIRETAFDAIPNKNSLPIKILFDCLDLRSIFYCWKALLFDKTLVLVSSQYSLQFYVAEALKQLIFPFTWQNSYVQPGSAKLLEICDGTMPMIYGSQSYVGDYDYFDGKSPEMAVVDIDASFTNNIDMPLIPNEQMYIRILNLLKNARISQYDKAYPEPNIENEDFVTHVRQTFFQILKPYIRNLDDYIDRKDPDKTNFNTYFDKAKYLDNFDFQIEHNIFAKQLCESSQFQHFCDDSFNADELNNYHMLKAVLQSRAEGQGNSDDVPFQQSEDHVKIVWPESSPLVFNFRMPQDHRRVMLFEKLYYMNKDNLDKKAKDTTRQTNKQIVDNIHFEEIIDKIKQLYPIKLKGTHLMFAAQDQKIMEQNEKRKQKGANDNSDYSITVNEQPQKQIQRPLIKRMTSGLPLVQLEDNMTVGAQKIEMKFVNSNISPHIARQQTNNSDAIKLPLFKQLLLEKQQTLKQNYDYMQGSKDEAYNFQISFSEGMLEDDEQRIQNHPKRIIKLIYGSQGLLTVMHHLFGLLHDHELRSTNYYFALKEQLNQMNTICKPQSKEYGLDVIIEQQEDLQLSPRHQTYASPTPTSNQIYGSQAQSHRSKSIIQHPPQQNQQLFKENQQWFCIDEWDKMNQCIKYSHQYILFKVKLYETFESYEDGSSKIFYDLIKFPQDKMQFFPKRKYMQIWDNCTQQQKVQIFEKFGKNQQRQSISMISKEFLAGLGKGKSSMSQDGPDQRNGSKTDDSIFYQANAEKSYVQKMSDKQTSSDVSTVSSSGRSTTPINFLCQQSQKKKQDAAFNQGRNLIKSRLKKGKSNEDGSGLSLKKDNSLKAMTFAKHTSFNPACYKFDEEKKREVTIVNNANSQSCVQNFDMGGHFKLNSLNIKLLDIPDKRSASLLENIIEFWNQNSQFVESRGCFKAIELPRIQEEMRKYDNSLGRLKDRMPDFQGDDIVKQCFFLNIFNFLVLHRIAVMMISERDAVKQLNNYNRWQNFLQSCEVFIGGTKMDAYQIQHYILRAKLTLPTITRFMINSFEYDRLDFQIRNPNKLLSFGFFLPIKGLPKLQIFKRQTFDEQLRTEAQAYLLRKIKVKEDHKLIVMPKLVKWYLKDFKTANQKYFVPTLCELLRCFALEILTDCQAQEVRETILKIVEQIKDKEKEKEYIVHFRYFTWVFVPKRMDHYFRQHRQSDTISPQQ